MPSSVATPTFTSSRAFITAAGVITAALGLVVLAGWYAHIPAVVQLRPNLAPMQYNTALCILFSGAGLCAFNWSRRRMLLVFGGLVFIIAGLTLYEYLTGIDLGIDQLVFRAYITSQTSNQGRMSPASALCLSQIGLALLLMGLRVKTKWSSVAIGSLGSVVIAVCTVAITGYAIKLPGTYGWGQLTRIALHTATGLALLGAGIFVVAWDKGREKDELTPRWLPVPMGLSILAASLVFFQALESRQNQEIAQAIKASAEGVKSVITVRTEARTRSLVRMAKRWEFSGRPSQAAWEDDAKNYTKDFPAFQAIEWIDASRLVRWIVPLAGNEAKLNRNFTLEERRSEAVNLARESHEPVVTRIVQLSRGGLGFIVYIPIFTGATFDGWIAGVFNAQTLFDRYLPDAVASGYAITVSEGGQLFYERYPGPQPSNADRVVNSAIEQRGATWNVRVWPTPALIAQMDSPLPELVLLAGLGLSILVGITIYLAQKSSANARKTAALNRELETALAEVKTLSGMLPICAGCKRIRDDGGYWSQIERYISKHSDASFSHGFCPECAKNLFVKEGMEVPDEIMQAVEKHHYD